MFNRFRSLFAKQSNPPAADTSKYFRASIGRISGGNGTDSRATYTALSAVKRYRSWVYAAAQINAFGVSSVPLRLYVKSGGSRKLYRTGPVLRERRGYLLGEQSRSPSRRPRNPGQGWTG